MSSIWRRWPAVEFALAAALLSQAVPTAMAAPADGRLEVAQATFDQAANKKNKNKGTAQDPDKDVKKAPAPKQGGSAASANTGSGFANTPAKAKAVLPPKPAAKVKPPVVKAKPKAAPQEPAQAKSFSTNPIAQPRATEKKAVKKITPPAPDNQFRKVPPPASAGRAAPPTAVAPNASGAGNQPAGIAARAVPAKRPTKAAVKRTYVVPPKSVKKIEDMKRGRKEQTVQGSKVRVFKEADRRVIIKNDNRVFINHDDSDRFRRVSRNARTARRSDGYTETIIVRDGGVKIINVVDDDGYLLYRLRRDRYGRETYLIDNRRYREPDRISGRDLAIGVGVGLAVGAAIVALAPPVHAVPSDKYIVDYGRASDDDIYEALTAPPVERLERTYSLDEVRYSDTLRERMRRVDLDNVTFDFGSWEVGSEQFGALERIADGIMRALERNADEVFLIEGHTDAVGDEDDNLSLSDRRAQSVAEILTSTYGVPPENLVTQGYGEQFLKVRTQEPERTNRRIAIRRISPLMSEQFRN